MLQNMPNPTELATTSSMASDTISRWWQPDKVTIVSICIAEINFWNNDKRTRRIHIDMNSSLGDTNNNNAGNDNDNANDKSDTCNTMTNKNHKMNKKR